MRVLARHDDVMEGTMGEEKRRQDGRNEKGVLAEALRVNLQLHGKEGRSEAIRRWFGDLLHPVQT